MGEDQAFHDVETGGVLLEHELGSAGDDLDLEVHIVADKLSDRHHLRRAIFQAEVDDTEGGLKLGVLQEVIRDDFWDGVLTDLDDDADTVFVGFIADIGDAFDDFVTDKGGDVFDHRGLVDLIWNLIDDDAGLAVFHLFDVIFGTDGDGTLTGGIGV